MADIHKFKYKDDYFVLDVNSGSIHVVDEIVYDMIDENGLEDEPSIPINLEHKLMIIPLMNVMMN